MQHRPSWAPKGVDLEKASAARAYDYYLGGAHNFAVDREFARKVEGVAPTIRELAQNNRGFLRRAVQYCAARGIRQFLDLGSGIPTVGNVHEVAQEAEPTARVLYVDNDPVAVAHSETILEGNDRAGVVRADMTDVDGVLDSPEAKRLLDFDEPIAVMMVAVLHFVPDEQRPAEIVRRYTDRLAPGSYVALSHGTADHCPEMLDDIVGLYANSSNPLVPRTRSEITALLPELRIVEPGVVHVPDWHPDSPEDRWERPEESVVYVAVAQKP